MESVWTNSVQLPQFSQLDKDINTQVLIIGGGIAGILCGYLLKQAGVEAVIVEKDRICGGVTANTTAKITVAHGLIYNQLITKFGTSKAKMYLDANLFALQKYRQMCKNIDCDFENKTNTIYSMKNNNKIKLEKDALNSLGMRTQVKKETELPFLIDSAISLKNQGQFNPLKFIANITQGLKIFENTKVEELIGNLAITKNAKIKAQNIIVATHFPFINKHGSYFLKMYQSRSYVIALENAPQYNAMYLDEYDKGLSFRNYKDLLLIGGGDHRTGKQGGNWSELEKFAIKYFPDAKEKFRWATQDCMTLDRVPYIGQYSKNTPNFYVATGYNKWGMTGSMVSAMLLSDMIMGKKNPFAEAFDPSRSIIRGQLVLNAFEAVTNLLTISKKRCPHLGCALKWNGNERSWDCPCHGSRFDENGKVIDNPANGDLKI